jgi:hypothetical protein
VVVIILFAIVIQKLHTCVIFLLRITCEILESTSASSFSHGHRNSIATTVVIIIVIVVVDIFAGL